MGPVGGAISRKEWSDALRARHQVRGGPERPGAQRDRGATSLNGYNVLQAKLLAEAAK